MKFLRILILSTFISLFVFSGFGQRLVVDPGFSPALNGSVEYLKVLPDQTVLIVGGFTTVNGQARSKIAIINPNGSLDTRFDANWLAANNSGSSISITALSLDSSGKIYIAAILSQNGNYSSKIFRLNSDGSQDQSLTTIPLIEGNVWIYKIQPQPDGKFFVCGTFSTINGNPRTNVARLNNDGSLDTTLTTQINDVCQDAVIQPDGKYLVAGTFSTVNGETRKGLVRLNTDGSTDTSFNAYSVNNQYTPDKYNGIKLLSDGTIYIFQNQYIGNIIHLNADGSLKKPFVTDVQSLFGHPGNIEVLPSGKILAVGDFFTAGTTSSHSDWFNRFTPDGRHDGSIKVDFFGSNPGASTLGIAADEKIIVGGGFTTVQTNGVSVSKSYLARLMPQPVPIKHKYDFDGDGKDDLAIFRPSEGIWYMYQSTNGFTARQFGISTDKPVAADYDRDGKADIAVFRDGVWYWLRSSDNAFVFGVTGQAGDIPQPGFRGRFALRGSMLTDGTAGLLAFRPSTAAFYLQNTYQAPYAVNVGNMSITSSSIPVSADYDGDEYDDVAVFRDGVWSYLSSNDARVWSFQFGLAGDIPVPADYDGDGRTDYAVYRPSTGVWYLQKSTEGFYAVQWGISTDLPVPADYDGDRKSDIGVYRDGIWYILNADGSYKIENWGLAGDIPAQSVR